MIYPRLLNRFSMLVFFTNLRFTEFQVRYLALFLLFSVIDGFGWFWMGNLHKNIQLMLEFLKAPFLVLHFPLYTFITFLIMLSVKLLSILMVVSDQSSDLWQQLELASELEFDLQDTVEWDRWWLVDFNAGKSQLVSCYWSNNTGTIKILGLISLRSWIGALTLSLLLIKTASKKIGALIRSMKFLFPEVALYLYKSTICPLMEYCCHAWAGAPWLLLQIVR